MSKMIRMRSSENISSLNAAAVVSAAGLVQLSQADTMVNNSGTSTSGDFDAAGQELADSLQIHPEDAVVVILILLAWFSAIALFLNKWGSILTSQPQEVRYKHYPKNLESIKVVKHTTDSVIYKGCSPRPPRAAPGQHKQEQQTNSDPGATGRSSTETAARNADTKKTDTDSR